MMKIKRKFILIMFMAVSIFAIGAFLYLNSFTNKGLDNKAIRSSTPDIKIEKARYVETKDGRKEWELEADSTEYFKNDNLTVFYNVKVFFYPKEGTTYYTIEGNEGRLKNDIKDMDITGDIVITSSNGYQVKTDSLKYTQSLKQINTKDRIFLTGPKIKIEGTGLLVDIAEERVFVLADVRTELKDAAI